MQERPTSNPTNRFASSSVTYDEGDGPPPSSVTLLQDHSRSILSHNDSPDLGFSWSANPYRGCISACAYCLGPETRVLMGDSRTKRIADLVVGDEIYGTRLDGRHRRYVRTRVLDVWTTVKPAYRIDLSDGTALFASGDHRFLSNRGWKYVTGDRAGAEARPHLTRNHRLLGTGRFAMAPNYDEDYKLGYLFGLSRSGGVLSDLEALHRARSYLAELDTLAAGAQMAAGVHVMRTVRSSPRVHIPAQPALEWHKGFLAGAFDADGMRGERRLTIAASGDDAAPVIAALERLAFDYTVDETSVRVRGGLPEHMRFFHSVDPAITRSWSLDGLSVAGSVGRRVVGVTELEMRTLYDITTGTGDFVADGVISHNCYARPTHEYLDLGAGTDFDTKIVYKPRAPELLREAFDKPSWKGELVMFSGVTDCYQPFESKLELTRQCLEVCLEYRNPVAIISKHALVERDVGLIAELAREAGAHLSVSLAWIDAELARSIEPWAASPQRRLKVIETFAKAGVPVGVMCAPIIPGLNDDQLVRVLEAARSAGATSAGWTLLRLPGAVKEVFEDRVRVALPLAADKIMHRIRETRGGEKLYDSKFHTRGRGEGVYAQTIAALFDTTVRRLGLEDRDFERTAATSRFQRPQRGQLSLF